MYENKVIISTNGKQVDLHFEPAIITKKEQLEKLTKEEQKIQGFFTQIAMLVHKAARGE